MHGTSLNRSSLLFDYIFRVDFYNFKIKKEIDVYLEMVTTHHVEPIVLLHMIP